MARKIGINKQTPTEEQGYSLERLAAQLVGTLPPVTKYTTLGIPYKVYPRDKNHPRWQKPEARKKAPKKTETFEEIELIPELQEVAA